MCLYIDTNRSPHSAPRCSSSSHSAPWLSVEHRALRSAIVEGPRAPWALYGRGDLHCCPGEQTCRGTTEERLVTLRRAARSAVRSC